MHNATSGDPQFYTGCTQIQVQGATEETLELPSDYSVSIPGYFRDGDASVSFNIYSPVFPYPMPGPAVYTVPLSSSAADTTETTSNTTAVNGATLVPSSYLIKEANWVSYDVADYSIPDCCWNGSGECYNQGEVCYASAPPTGSRNCYAFEVRCKEIQDACATGTYDGPSNKGQMLIDAEARSEINVPAVNNLGTGGTSNGSSSSTTSAGNNAPVSAVASTMVYVTVQATITAMETTEAMAETTVIAIGTGGTSNSSSEPASSAGNSTTVSAAALTIASATVQPTTTAMETTESSAETTVAATSKYATAPTSLSGKNGKSHRGGRRSSMPAGRTATQSTPCERKARRSRHGGARW